MIAYLKGTLVDLVGDSEAVVQCGGVGYLVTVDHRGARVDDDVALHVHSITKETGTTLFAFEQKAERDLFAELLGAKGVGPKTAFAVVTNKGVGNVRTAIQHRDVAALIGKGCGQKAAAAIIEQLGDA